ncbi:MAG TPA: L-serine ammonia-lyase, iron-sulfur-dependent, subunit alpha [Selenomonadales bacterium]|nr:L-serine ammonia-lyase, iron-sulfur-dependent, subunit alpha [Selenomonadales bacterium]
MIRFSRISDLVRLADEHELSLAEVVWRHETERSQRTPEEVWATMAESLKVMRGAAVLGLSSRDKSFSGLVGGDANRLAARLDDGKCLTGPVAAKAAAYALAVSEVNAGMGKIVACPTAGSCGIVPGAMLAAADACGFSDEALIRGLFTAAGIGLVIAENASISGAFGGCQAECGSAAAMAAAAVVEMAGGTPAQSAEALALAMKNLLGLACDPVAGLVEVPCVKRNAFGAVHALLAAEMALAGITSVIPADEVIDAMHQIGLSMPRALKETSEGGLAKTPTAIKLTEKILGGK